MFDPAEIRSLLIEAARARSTVTYSQLLALLGHAFTRPLMRQLCKVLDRIDEDGRACGEPGLAVLMVRQADGLPGQGWFVTRAPLADVLPGAWPSQWDGTEARAYVGLHQQLAFDHWHGDTPAPARALTPLSAHATDAARPG